MSDNDIEWELNEADTHDRVTETVRNAVSLSDRPLFQAAGFEGDVYAGIIANTPRTDEALRFLRFIADHGT